MSKKIILLVILIIIALVLITYWAFRPKSTTGVQQENAPIATDLEKSCTDSGGKISSSLCCQSSKDFPNSCLIGACGCSPANSHEVKTCDCGAGKCFDGTKCTTNLGLSEIKAVPDQSNGNNQQPQPGLMVCQDKCGDGTCQQFVVCSGTNCVCTETKADCPQDCKK